MVTSDQHIRELAHAPLNKLSLHAVAKEMLQPKYTMYEFEWKDQRGIEGTGFVRALRSLLTAHLPVLRPVLRTIISENLDEQIIQSKGDDGLYRVPIFPLIKQVVTRANCVIFFGPDLANDQEFRNAALEFPQAVVFAAEILRVTPNCMKSFVANIATGGHRASKVLMKYLIPVIQERQVARNGKPNMARPVDCMQWVVDTSPRKTIWSAERIVGEILGLWFGSVHQLAITTTFAIHDLCLHPDWAHDLRLEVQEASSRFPHVEPESLPLLDCFAQESMRMNASDAISTRRKAIVPFTFSDGLLVATDDWVCVPQQAMMQDEQFYPQPGSFNPLRFLHPDRTRATGEPDSNVKAERRRLTDVNSRWPVWGLGNATCPGRFYASLCMKLVLTHILEHYECTIDNPRGSRSFSWRSSILPRSSTVVVLQ
ncbi:putative cytochrome P450, partial [Lentithecium fluviatile CBS 122367]